MFCTPKGAQIIAMAAAAPQTDAAFGAYFLSYFRASLTGFSSQRSSQKTPPDSLREGSGFNPSWRLIQIPEQQRDPTSAEHQEPPTTSRFNTFETRDEERASRSWSYAPPPPQTSSQVRRHNQEKRGVKGGQRLFRRTPSSPLELPRLICLPPTLENLEEECLRRSHNYPSA